MSDEDLSGPQLPAGFGAPSRVGAPTISRPAWELSGQNMPSAFDALGPRARSILAPGVILLVLVVGGVAALVIGYAGLATSLSDAQVFDAGEGSSPFDVSNADQVTCRSERRLVAAAVASYRALEDAEPRSTGDLIPDYLAAQPSSYRVQTVDGRAEVVPVSGGACDGSSGDDARTEDRARTATDTVAESASLGLAVVGMLAMGGAALYQGWFLATAYRCLPRGRQIHPSRRAYGPLLMYTLAALVIGSTAVALIASEVFYEEPLTATVIILLQELVFLFLIVRAVLRTIDMLGDVTFHFCDGHYVTSRLMRLCVKGTFLFPLASVLLAIGFGQADLTGTVPEAIVVATYVFGVIVCPLVLAICYVVAVSLAIGGVERALKAAAVELSRGSVTA